MVTESKEVVIERKLDGKFLPGHAPFVSNGGAKIGRPKTLKGEVRDALKIAEDAMPEIIASMIKRANGEEECPVAVQQAAAEYLCDRIYGRPNQPLSNKDGSRLQSFSFVLPAGFTPSQDGLLSKN